MITADEAYKKVSELFDRQAIDALTQIGEAITAAAEKGAMRVSYNVKPELYTRIAKMLSDYGYAVTKVTADDGFYECADNIEISWWCAEKG